MASYLGVAQIKKTKDVAGFSTRKPGMIGMSQRRRMRVPSKRLKELDWRRPIPSVKPPTTTAGVKLSPELLTLLRAEMGEIAAGVQRIALSIATADWKSIEETSANIRVSYIMEKKLTPAQAKELEEALPEQFKLLDAGFHQRAEKIRLAAKTHDAELITYEYSRLLESCTACHAAFARSRFPGFSSVVDQAGHH